MEEELDEFGIPIKKSQQVSSNVDEFGIPLKKKENAEVESQSPSEEVISVSDGLDTNLQSEGLISLPENHVVDESLAQLYKDYEDSGKIKPVQQQAIESKIKAQESGDRGFWETAIAVTEGMFQTGLPIPVFQYETKEDLISKRELKNKTDFLSDLPEEKLSELKSYAGEKITELDNSNLNILSENTLMKERGKQLVNELNKQSEAIEKIKLEGGNIPEEGALQYKKNYEELQSIYVAYNKNVDLIEDNNEDISGFYEEVNLLKKNYGGLDYYKDMARLTSANMMAGVAEFGLSTRDLIKDKTGIKPLIDAPFTQEDIDEFRSEVSNQQELQKSSMSVSDINGIADFGAWAGEQAATQLSVLAVLALTSGAGSAVAGLSTTAGAASTATSLGSSVGLGLLGISAAGQKIGDLEVERLEAKDKITSLKNLLNSGQDFSEEELNDINKTIKDSEKLSNTSDDEMYLAGLGVGALEVLTERVSLGILSKGKRAYLSAKKAGGNTFKEFSKGVGRSVASGMEEGGAEFINQFGSNLIDIMYLNDTDVHVFDGTLDALASGTAMGFGMRATPTGVGMGAKTFMSLGDTSKMKLDTKKISNLVSELKSNLSLDSDTKKMINSKIKKLKKGVSNTIDKVFKKVSNMPKEVISELIDLDKSANKISKRVKDLEKSDIDEQIKSELMSDLKSEIDVIKDRKRSLLEADYTVKDSTQEETEVNNPKKPTTDQVTRTFRITNPFKSGKPLVEIPLSQNLDSKLDIATQKIVDRFFPVKKVQSSIEKSRGETLPKNQNFRQAEITMHGKAASKMKDFSVVAENLIKDTTKSNLSEIKDKTKVDRLSDYLMARHAQERNAHIRKIPLKDPENQVVNESGSGMTDSESQKILDSFKGKELEDVQKLAKRVDNLIEETRQIMLDGGLITKEQKNVLTSYYDNYVPLQGFESEDLSSDMSSAFGLSLSVKGKETKKASGRTTKADNVIANIVGFRNNMIVRVEKNIVMQSLYEMVKQNPDHKIGQVFSKSRPDVKQGLTSGGKVGQILSNMSNLDKYVGVKIKGEQHYIKFENESLAKVINSASVEKTDIMTKTIGKFNRYLSTVLTTYNPEFMISNALRDIQAAIINQASESDITNNSLKGKSFEKATIKSLAPSIKAIYKIERGKSPDSEVEKYYKEFKEDGAKTDWFYARNVEDIKKDIQKIIKSESKGKDLVSGSIDAVKSIGRWLEDSNTAIENGVRLASYMEARKVGVTREDAAEFAKELTINFNQKGEWGTVANTLFLFFNASVQGTARFSKAMATLKKTIQDDGSIKYGLNKAQKIASAMTAASALNTMINILSSEDDEDGVSFYKKIPDYEKERNLIIMDPTSTKGNYFKIPLPYGYNIFHNLGTVATEVSMGERGTGDGVGFMINSIVGAFNPLSLSDSNSLWIKGTKAVSPTILKPAIELATNESHFGSSIFKENFSVGTPKPESHLGRPSTNRLITEVTRFMNEATGGSEYVSGWADINPDKIEHLFEFFGGGVLKFINKTSKTGNYLFERVNGEEVEIKPNEIPFLRKLYGEPSEFISREIYYDRKVEIDQLYDEYKSDLNSNKGEERYKGIPLLKRRQKSDDKKLKSLRKLIKKINKIEDPIKKSKKLKEARDKELKIINGFNKRFNELRVD